MNTLRIAGARPALTRLKPLRFLVETIWIATKKCVSAPPVKPLEHLSDHQLRDIGMEPTAQDVSRALKAPLIR